MKGKEIYENMMSDMDDEKMRTAFSKTPSKLESVSKLPYEFIRKLIKKVKLIYMMLKDSFGKKYKFPVKTVAAMGAALAYFIMPADAVPDFIPVIGYIDDLTVLNLCFLMVNSDIREYLEWKGLPEKEYL